MINKRSLWFLTLFSLILVLSVYYITMPNDLLLSNNSATKTEKETKKEENTKTDVKESELLVTMRINLEDEREKKLEGLRGTLTKEDVSSEEKNNAYEEIKYITNLSSIESSLEEKVKKEFDIDTFITIDNNNIKVVAIKENHDVNLANSIMKSIQKEFEEKKQITVQFEK